MLSMLCQLDASRCRGTLRELPKQALRRADAVVLHHVDLLGAPRTRWQPLVAAEAASWHAARATGPR